MSCRRRVQEVSEITRRLLALADACAADCDCGACFLLGCLARDCGHELLQRLHTTVIPLADLGVRPGERVEADSDPTNCHKDSR
ncbi:MAG: hypothetical protein AB2L07_11585 [Thermoanaerobaculaceae bacterium]